MTVEKGAYVTTSVPVYESMSGWFKIGSIGAYGNVVLRNMESSIQGIRGAQLELIARDLAGNDISGSYYTIVGLGQNYYLPIAAEMTIVPDENLPSNMRMFVNAWRENEKRNSSNEIV